MVINCKTLKTDFMMKNIILYTILIGFIVLISCKKDETKVTVNNDKLVAPVMALPANNLTVIVSKDNLNDSVKFSWSAADYTVNLPVTYAIEIDSAGKKTANLGLTTKTSISLALTDLNSKLLGDLKIPGNVLSTLQIKVVSKLDNGQLPLTSERLGIKIQTYKEVEIVYPIPAKLFIPGGYQASGGDPSKDDALTIFSMFGADSLKIYDGYVNIPNSTWIKFTPQPSWTPNWGGSKDSLISDGADIDCPVAGYYNIRINLNTKKYSVYQVKSFGIIGDGTPGGWNASTPMTYDNVNMLWKISNVALIKGALKFRANDEWPLNYGPANSNDQQGTLKFDDPGAISIPAAGNYDVIVDFSKSKGSHKDFTYKVIPR